MKALLVSLAILTQAPVSTSATAPWSWNDSRGPREAWLDLRAIAEIDPSFEGAQALHALDVAALEQPGSPRVRLWSLSLSNAAAVLAALEAKLPGHFAPVFHDEQSAASKLRVPAGGVLVWLTPTADVARLIARHRLVVRQRFGNATLLVEAAPGAVSLALTSALISDPDVKTAMPNWWFRAHRR